MSFELDVAVEDMLAMLTSDEVSDFDVTRILNLIRFLLNSLF